MLSRAAFSAAPRVARAASAFTPSRSLAVLGNSDEDIARVLKMAKDEDVEVVDFRFTDLLGRTVSMPFMARMLDEDKFKNGISLDGSSVAMWQGIENSDMSMRPRAESAFIDPFHEHKHLVMYCEVVGPDGVDAYERDPRAILRQAQDALRDSGVADHVRFGLEPEFFVFDNVKFGQSAQGGFYEVDHSESSWNQSRDAGQYGARNMGHQMRDKEGYLLAAPHDTTTALRDEIALECERMGLRIEASHHEVAPAQCEIDLEYAEALQAADEFMMFKYIAKNVGMQHDQSVTFLPKPLHEDNGSGMHMHISLHDDAGANLMTGDGYGGLSEKGLHFIGGIRKHAEALCAFTNPTTNSYRRMQPGFEAPTTFAMSKNNRSVAFRIPASHPKARRIEYRLPDPSLNPYLSFAALMCAGIDGVKNQISPGRPEDRDLFELPESKLRRMKRAPASLASAAEALRKDNAFLQPVFSKTVIDNWVARKVHESSEAESRPTPMDFKMYYDC